MLKAGRDSESRYGIVWLLAIIISILAVLPHCSIAQGRLEVKVLDRFYKPVSGAIVTVSGRGMEVNSITGEDGRAIFEDLPSGEYEVRAFKMIIGSARTRVSVSGTSRITMILEPKPYILAMLALGSLALGVLLPGLGAYLSFFRREGEDWIEILTLSSVLGILITTFVLLILASIGRATPANLAISLAFISIILGLRALGRSS